MLASKRGKCVSTQMPSQDTQQNQKMFHFSNTSNLIQNFRENNTQALVGIRPQVPLGLQNRYKFYSAA